MLILPEHVLKPSSEINVTELINQEQLLMQMSPSKSLPLRSIDIVSQQDNYRKISNISTASTDSAYTSDTNMTYKQLTDINQVPNMVEVLPESFVANGNDNIYHQDSHLYQNVEPTINPDPSTFIPNTMTQWNYQINSVQNQLPTSGTDEELQRKISTVSTVSNLSSLSSDSVQGLVQQDIQHHAIIHEENVSQNNQNIYVQNQEGLNVNLTENANYCNTQSPLSESYPPSVQVYQENQLCTNYNNQTNLPEEISVVEEKPVDIIEPLTNSTESDVRQNLR